MNTECGWYTMTQSLCETCKKMREILTPKGSRFVLCQLSLADPRYPKYPPQPIVRCDGYEGVNDAEGRPQSSSR